MNMILKKAFVYNKEGHIERGMYGLQTVALLTFLLISASKRMLFLFLILNCMILPGLIDFHVHLREPGFLL
jgi:dihydroorotase-like cyclic amidohydrolase